MGRASSRRAGDETARAWDTHGNNVDGLVAEVCARQLHGRTGLSHDERRLAGYSDDTPEIRATTASEGGRTIGSGLSTGPVQQIVCYSASVMVYALLMILVLLTLGAVWRKHPLQIPLFLATLAWLLLHFVNDITTPLTLSF